MRNNRFRKTKIVLSSILTIVIALLFVFAISNTIDKYTNYNTSFFGVRSSVITSNSMGSIDESMNKVDYLDKGTLHRGDLIFTYEYKDYDDIKIGDIITYYNGETLVCHRVIDKIINNEVESVITQGDANNTNDGVIPYSLVKGKVVFFIPSVGYATLYLQSYYGLLAISLIILIVVISLIIYECLKYKENKNKDIKIEEVKYDYPLNELINKNGGEKNEKEE